MVVDILTGRNKITFSKSLFNQMGVGILAFCVFETFIEKSTLEKFTYKKLALGGMKMAVKMKPLGDRVVIAPSEVDAEKSAGGIYDGSLSIGSAGDALKVNGAGNALEFGTIEGSVISTVGTTFANWNNITSNLTTNLPTTQNKFLAGPITVTSPAVWQLTGTGTITII